MNQFLIIVRGSDHSVVSPEKMQKRLERFGEWVQKVLDGRYVAGAPLEDTDARLLKSKTEVHTDGPFLESKEMISGYFGHPAEPRHRCGEKGWAAGGASAFA